MPGSLSHGSPPGTEPACSQWLLGRDRPRGRVHPSVCGGAAFTRRAWVSPSPRAHGLDRACRSHPRTRQLLALTGACRPWSYSPPGRSLSFRAPNNSKGGNPRGTSSLCISPRPGAGRRRAIGVVAAAPLSFSRPRRWCDAQEPPNRRRLRRPASRTPRHGRSGRDRLHHFRIAYASAKDVNVHLRILCLSQPSHRDNATTALQLFDQVRAMTWRLLNPRT